MISAIAIIDITGEVILIKQYRKDFNQSAFENFRLSVISQNENPSPTNFIDGHSFCCHMANNLFYVACTRQNADASLIFQLLTQMPAIFSQVLNVASLNDQNIGNFVPDIIEILDEMLDSGYPQITEPEALQLLCQKQEPNATPISIDAAVDVAIGQLPWRQPNITYKKQKIIVDIIEKFSLITNEDGTIQTTFIDGVTRMNAQINGNQTCTFVFNSKQSTSPNGDTTATTGTINFDDIIFHQCVKLDKFDTKHEITFTPPNSPFDLMKYRKEEGISPPFEIKPTMQISGQKFELVIKVTATYDQSLKSSPFTLTIPLPQRTANVQFDTSAASKAKYNDLKNAIIWTIPEFAGHSTAHIRITSQYLDAQIKSSSSSKGVKAITAEFHIPKLSTSGLSFLNLTCNSPQKPDSYVRYTTENGIYQISIPGLDDSNQQ